MTKYLSWIIFGFVSLIFLIFMLHEVPGLRKSGKYEIPNLNERVSVHFDHFGIPHIKAQNNLDAYRALGFIMAKERLFQMDLLRRLVNGSFSEVFGEEMLEVDILMRKLLFKHTALKNVELLKGTVVYDELQAFLEGVNEVVENHFRPIEFWVAGYKPEKFTADELVGVAYYMALTFAEGLNGDVFLSEMMETLPEEKLKAIRVGDTLEKTKTPIDFESVETVRIDKIKILKKINRSLDKLSQYIPLFHGSNSWVLAGHRSKSGKPILGNDPHISVSSPHIFYEAHIKTEDIEIYGHFIPVAPYPILGHTPYSAWAVTMSEVDDLTIYQEKLNPQNKNEVMYKGEWVELRKIEEVIKIKGERDFNLTVKISPHGPLIDESKYGVEGKNLSLTWSVHHPENNLIKSLYELPYAKTVDEFKTAVSHAASPGLNLSWVNNSGDIAWWVMGKYPKLPDGVPYDIVLNGWDGKSEIERFYSIDENPHQVNPSSGIIISANYKPQVEEFSHFHGYWQPGGRYFRLMELFHSKDVWSLDELKAIQTDVKVPKVDSFKSSILQAIDQSSLNSTELTAFEIFKNWDGNCKRKSKACLIYNKLNYFISFNLFADEMGEEGFRKFGKTALFWHSYKFLISDLKNSFWDNIKTNRVESGSEIILKAFQQTVLDLKNRYGENSESWKWEKAHTTTYEHPLGKVKPLNLIYNIGPVSAQGSRYAINNQAHKKYLNDFSVVHAPATRRLIDMNSPRESLGILPTGNSGNPFSLHYDDQLKLYHSGEYRLQDMDWDRIETFPQLDFVRNGD